MGKMMIKITNVITLFSLVIALGFLSRGIYWFYRITLDGGIVLKESNQYIAISELLLITFSFIALFYLFIKTIFDYSKKFITNLKNEK